MVLAFCIAFICGPIFATLTSFNPALFYAVYSYYLPNLFIACISLFFAFLLRNFARILFACIAGLLFGFIRAAIPLADQLALKSQLGHEVTLIGTIIDDPIFEDDAIKVTLGHIVIAPNPKIYDSSARIVLSASVRSAARLSRSDQLTLKGALQSGFTGAPVALYHPQLLAISKPDPPDFSLHLREAFATKISALLADATESKLAMGYLLGQKSDLPFALNNALKRVGLAHAVVASGYNLAILITLAKRHLVKFSRALALFAALFLIVAFISITGLSPSMLRAALVSTLSLFAWYFGRKFHPARLLIYSASLSLLANPSYLLNLGWQLSFASFSGILLLGPILVNFFYARQTPHAFTALLLETLAAQISCLPLTLANFGSFSAISLVANLLVVPTIPLAMLLIFLTGTLAFFIPLVPFSVFVAQFLHALLMFHLKTINALGALPWASYDFSAPNYALLALYLPIILFAAWLFRHANFSFRPILAKVPKDGKIYAC